MPKPILFYALLRAPVGRWTNNGFEVVAVTSVAHRQVYGRTVPDDGITHAAERDVFHRFPDGTTREFALAARDRASKEAAKHDPEIARAQQRVENLRGHRAASVLEAAKGIGLAQRPLALSDPDGDPLDEVNGRLA